MEHSVDVQRAGGAVEHRQAIEQKAAGHGAEHEVLHGSFRGHAIVTTQGHQGVTGQGQQFQPEVQHQKVVARNHDEHAQQGEQAQGEQFAATQHVSVCRIRATVDQGGHHGDGRKAFEPVAHGVGHHHVAKAVHRGTGAGVQALQERHSGQGQQGQDIGHCAGGGFHAQVDQRNHASHHQQQDFRVSRHPTQVVNHLLIPLIWAAWTEPRGSATQPPRHPSRR